MTLQAYRPKVGKLRQGVVLHQEGARVQSDNGSEDLILVRVVLQRYASPDLPTTKLVKLEYLAGNRMFSTAPQMVQKQAREWPAGGPSVGFRYCISFSSWYKGADSGLAAGLLSFYSLLSSPGALACLLVSPPCGMPLPAGPEQPLFAAGTPS